MLINILKFFVYSLLIVGISKYILVRTLRNLAENLNLKSRTIGNIAGIATSIPEFLTVTISSFRGLVGTSLYNIISSNVINLMQYSISIVINKNYKEVKHKAIVLQIGLVVITIIVPMLLLKVENLLNIWVVILFMTLYSVFLWISKKVYDKYLNYDEQKNNKMEKEEHKEKGIKKKSLIKEKNNKKDKDKKIYIYVLYIILAGILLYFVGDALGNVLENLASIFKIAESVLGILLGAITSIPELITFFEAQKHYKKKKEKTFLGVIEATNNLVMSNMLNVFVIQSIGIFIYIVMY